MKISELAQKTGVTVKTLLYYDKIGLLKPIRNSNSLYRIYQEEDLIRLQQIITLKYIGLSLNEIRQVLYGREQNLENMISIQKKALEEKKRHIESVISVFEKSENQIKENGFLDVSKLIDIIKITNMERKVKEQYITDEKLNSRLRFHSYNINKTDWTNWCFNEMKFSNKSRILELGSGTGDFWYSNSKNVKDSWDITVSDFSEGMLLSAKDNLKDINHKFSYKQIDVQDIPYEDESFDIVIARHMLYLVPDIEKAIREMKRVLVKGGTLYITTNSCMAMAELNELIKNFDFKLGLHTNGMCDRFDLENGYPLLKKYFDEVKVDILEGKIVIDDAELIASYKASTIKGSSMLVGNKRREFTKYLENYIKEKGKLAITTKAGIFKAVKFKQC
ncbi:MerR family transcriptional regulator [Clostridium hydrogenum]|uniref:MerR family transcriptional regulator n=1 Tax=Clostridium hydrogenum TaxID=2855764 RepID=UPI001F488E1F|nr:MerR family transcriptional regulator [Clostridium hydrogenum]